MYLESFVLPIDKENDLLRKRAEHNGGPKYGYIDNSYPCGLFSELGFGEVHFEKITIFYGGNGSGKSTLLNLISEKLKLNRIAPYNSSEMFASYVSKCKFSMGYNYGKQFYKDLKVFCALHEECEFGDELFKALVIVQQVGEVYSKTILDARLEDMS